MRNLVLLVLMVLLIIIACGLTAQFTDNFVLCFIAGMGYGAIASMTYTYLKEED